jgi:hypothetical protein
VLLLKLLRHLIEGHLLKDRLIELFVDPGSDE